MELNGSTFVANVRLFRVGVVLLAVCVCLIGLITTYFLYNGFVVSHIEPVGHSLTDLLFAGLGALVSLVLALLVLGLDFIRRRSASHWAALQESNIQLTKCNKDLNQFTAVASHDLQTPVRNVAMSIGLLEAKLAESGQLCPEVKAYIGALENSAEKMGTLVKDLLIYAKCSEASVNVTDVEMQDVVSEVKDMLHESILATKAKVTSGKLPLIACDRLQLERVFLNLINNAIKYAHKERSPVIEIGADRTKDEWNFYVKDNGMGIATEFQQSVFEPFQRLHSGEQIAGSGLGLGICVEIIKRHGGTLHIASSSNAGTLFRFNLPVHAMTGVAA